jgi:hypothetical protein
MVESKVLHVLILFRTIRPTLPQSVDASEKNYWVFLLRLDTVSRAASRDPDDRLSSMDVRCSDVQLFW